MDLQHSTCDPCDLHGQLSDRISARVLLGAHGRQVACRGCSTSDLHRRPLLLAAHAGIAHEGSGGIFGSPLHSTASWSGCFQFSFANPLR